MGLLGIWLNADDGGCRASAAELMDEEDEEAKVPPPVPQIDKAIVNGA